MKKNDIVSGTVYRTDFPDKGYVQIKDEDGEHVMKVKGVLPGQEILARVTRRQIQAETGKERLEGRLESVIKESPDSVLSPCPHFGECGGCAYLSLPYDKAAKLKEEQVMRLLEPVWAYAANKQNSFSKLSQGLNEADLNDSLVNRQSQFQNEKKDTPFRPLWEELQGSPDVFGYRNKMEFTFGDAYKGGPLTLGMHKLGHFHDIVSVTDCQIVDADYRLVLQKTLDFFGPLYENGQISFYNRMQKSGYLRHLLVRKGIHAGEILIDLITTSQFPSKTTPLNNKDTGFNISSTEQLPEESDQLLSTTSKGVESEKSLSVEDILDNFKNSLLNLSSQLNAKIAGILHTINDAEADAIIDQGTKILYGREYFEENLLGITFTVTPFSFFQTNSGGAEVLYSKVREYCEIALKKDTSGQRVGTIYDLYCGTGTITQLVSPYADKVVGVEIVPEAVEAARINAEKNNISNATFICGDVLKEIELLDCPPDLMILDPPRDGIHPKALPKIIDFNAKSIIYVSCKPTSLARDLPYILSHGYICTHVVCVDQFPWTRHVETVVLLSRQ